jgi:hypothetical protein
MADDVKSSVAAMKQQGNKLSRSENLNRKSAFVLSL